VALSHCLLVRRWRGEEGRGESPWTVFVRICMDMVALILFGDQCSIDSVDCSMAIERMYISGSLPSSVSFLLRQHLPRP